MIERPPDLLTLLAQARQLVPDERHIWCCAADFFESRLVQRRGLLLGGAVSPHFLRDSSTTGADLPWAMRLMHCRVIVCDKAAHEPVAAWLPLLEAIAGAGESLLVVTDTIGSELLRTFVVNALKGTLRVCVARPARARFGTGLAPGMDALGRACSTPPADANRLARVGEIWVRRTASALFPNPGENALPESSLQDFAIIETGGEHHEDQQERLRFLMREIQGSAIR